MWNMTSCWIWQVVEIWQAVEHQAPLIGHYACSVASFKLSSEIVDSSYTLLSLSHPHWCTDSPWSSMFMLLSALLWLEKSLKMSPPCPWTRRTLFVVDQSIAVCFLSLLFFSLMTKILRLRLFQSTAKLPKVTCSWELLSPEPADDALAG
jgi:hypothetical protein